MLDIMLDIFVINLHNRPDRWHQINHLLGKHFNLIRVEGIQHHDGWKGCFLSHKKCLKIAKEQNLKHIIVMEDDCVPFINISNFCNRLLKVKKQIEGQWWDIILGGVFSNEKINVKRFISNRDLLYAEIDKGFCTHLIFYNHTSYDFFIHHPLNQPIDHVWHNKLKAFVLLPFLANQRPNYSDISKQNISYIFDNLIKTNLELLYYQKQKSKLNKTLNFKLL